jgi:outer membrane protein assembly factor BamB
VSDGVVYVGSYDRNIYAIDAATGMKRWNVTTGGGIGSSPCVSNGVVYVGSDDGAIYALDTATGELQWTFPTGSYVLSSPCISDGIVYVGSYDNKLYAIDAGMGRKRGIPDRRRGAVLPVRERRRRLRRKR